jgi:molecular chaperone GrpE
VEGSQHKAEQQNADGTTSSAKDEAQKAAPEAGEELQKRVAELEAKVKDSESKYLYLYAEFENYKKRAIKERSDTLKFGWEPLARELLQVVDNLERALEHMPPGSDKVMIDGIEMVLKQFKGTLEKQGVKYISSLETSFDPNVHEAVGQEASEKPAGTVVKEHTRGYTLHGRLLRPARVVVSGGRAS